MTAREFEDYLSLAVEAFRDKAPDLLDGLLGE